MLRVSVLHALEDAEDVGILTERILDATGGAAEREGARYGWSESATAPWNRNALQTEGMERSPDPSAWCLLSESSRGTVTLRPSLGGIVEEVDVDLGRELDSREMWEAVKDLVPLMFTMNDSAQINAHLVHATLMSDASSAEESPGGEDDSSVYTPTGYRGFIRDGEARAGGVVGPGQPS